MFNSENALAKGPFAKPVEFKWRQHLSTARVQRFAQLAPLQHGLLELHANL
jgi:hypothetical protein